MHRECIAVAICVTVLLSGCMSSEEQGPSLIGTEYRDPPEAPDFTLKNQDGLEISLSDFEGKVVVVAFIYTSCPDVCLIISSSLAYVFDNLGEHEDDVEIISITIDPARDTVSQLSRWTSDRGYEWNHLTHERGSVMESVWENWNVVVDASHIANSLPPDRASLRFAVLFPDNSTIVADSECEGTDSECFENVSSFAGHAISGGSGINYDMANGTIGNWTSDESWSWELYSWNGQNESWSLVDTESIDSMDVTVDTNLAWAASNANISELPPGFDCNGHGWIMGSGGGAHCMCDDGYERPDGDWLSCIPEDTGNDSGEDGHADDSDPHGEALMQYEVGHSTVTFIVDKEHRKRVAYSGITWSADDFLHDVKELADQ